MFSHDFRRFRARANIANELWDFEHVFEPEASRRSCLKKSTASQTRITNCPQAQSFISNHHNHSQKCDCRSSLFTLLSPAQPWIIPVTLPADLIPPKRCARPVHRGRLVARVPSSAPFSRVGRCLSLSCLVESPANTYRIYQIQYDGKEYYKL